MIPPHRFMTIYNLFYSGRSKVRETAFWRNYFYHCEMARRDHLARRRNEHTGTLETGTNTKSGKHANLCSTLHHALGPKKKDDDNDNDADENENSYRYTPGDDASLVPASLPDDSSYVISSAPNSMNMYGITMSIDDDMVLVAQTGKN
jgi:hypothetical protein